ncbi:Uncharacterised protein [uncultured archaeon]|nr:Uncharacterised protein [uncultured archaeon]
MLPPLASNTATSLVLLMVLLAMILLLDLSVSTKPGELVLWILHPLTVVIALNGAPGVGPYWRKKPEP